MTDYPARNQINQQQLVSVLPFIHHRPICYPIIRLMVHDLQGAVEIQASYLFSLPRSRALSDHQWVLFLHQSVYHQHGQQTSSPSFLGKMLSIRSVYPSGLILFLFCWTESFWHCRCWNVSDPFAGFFLWRWRSGKGVVLVCVCRCVFAALLRHAAGMTWTTASTTVGLCTNLTKATWSTVEVIQPGTKHFTSSSGCVWVEMSAFQN